MSSETQDRLVNAFAEAAGSQIRTLEGAVGNTVALANEVGSAAKAAEEATSQVSANRGVYAASATPVGSDVRGTATSGSQNDADHGSTVGSIVSTFFESGLGMASLVKGLVGLFGGGGSPTPSPLQRYEMPPSILFESAETPSGLGGVDYDQFGRPRALAPSGDASPAAPSGSQPAPQITVNVQTMDAQSFLDHSSQIAQAVRGAMLNLSSINDVMNEL